MSCPRCGGMSAAELLAAIEQLVCEETVITGPYCHCHDVDGSMWACLLPEEKNATVEPPNDRGISEISESKRP